VKKVRYSREFFASLNPDGRRTKARRKIDRALKGLQSALGDLNDMRVHMYWARDFARSNADARKAFAIGYVTGREDAYSRNARQAPEKCSIGAELAVKPSGNAPAVKARSAGGKNPSTGFRLCRQVSISFGVRRPACPSVNRAETIRAFCPAR
jgi:hypothetical protein